MLESIFNVVLLVLGFGFVIFIHELGHFLAAKWCDVKVEQFALGFGQALVSWRKGLGLTWGSSGKRYEQILKGEAPPPPGVDPGQISETEYRWNWIPLGGYVKMSGQDDLRPVGGVDDPRAYNRKSIGQRMVIVSAGVIMNIILAAIGFMVLFLVGFRAPPALVGDVLPGSPAQNTRLVNADGTPGALAPLQVGDRILMFDGKWQHDFTKIGLNAALARENEPTLIYVRRVDGTEERLYITPRRPTGARQDFLSLGIQQAFELRGPTERQVVDESLADGRFFLPDVTLLRPGDTIVAINGEPLPLDEHGKPRVSEIWRLDRAVQASEGRPIELTIADSQGNTRQASFRPSFQMPFGGADIHFAGMVPRPCIRWVNRDSTVVGQILPGDIVMRLAHRDGSFSNLTADQLRQKLSEAGHAGMTVDITVLRDGQEVEVKGVSPSLRVGRDEQGVRYGIGVLLGLDEYHAVVADTLRDSPAAAAGIPGGARIVSVAGRPVESWFDVRRILMEARPGEPLTVVAERDGQEQSYTLSLNADEISTLASYRLTHSLQLHEYVQPRKTSNPLEAMWWGVIETRDFVLQFYLTIHRMVQGSVSYKNMMGPVGIFSAGTHFAYKGTDWLIWFLSMISANLAVVNFLPIPIVDGGLFTFLIIEKIQGRPISERTQWIAQLVGLAMIISVFLLVTYQDIARLGGY